MKTQKKEEPTPNHNGDIKGKGKKRSTLSKQISYKVILFVAVIFSAMMIITMMIVQSTVSSLSKDVLEKEAQSNVNEINGWVNNRLTYMNGVLGTMRNVEFQDNTQIYNYLASAIKNENSNASDIYIADNGSLFIDGTGYVPDASFKPYERSWYKTGIQKDSMVIGDAYQDTISKDYVVSISGKVSGTTVLSADVSLKTIVDQVKSIKTLNDGYAFLVEKSSDIIIAHNDDDRQGVKLSESGTKFLQSVGQNINSTTVMELSDGSDKYFIKMTPVENTEWVLVSCATYQSVMGQLDTFKIVIGAISVVVFILLLFFTQIIIKYSTKSMGDLTLMINRIAGGDFTEKAKVVGNNEITTIAESLNQYIDTMHDTMTKITEATREVTNGAATSNQVAKNVNTSVNVQKDAMGQMNQVVADISKSIEELAGNATTLAGAVSEVNTNSLQAKDHMKDTVDAADRGKNEITTVSDKMNQMTDTMKNLEATVRQVSESMKEINKISDLIGDIASQTNLLSLNASIEAARAGEAGKGFAVVASEIGNLATMSSDAVAKIAHQIAQIDQEVEETVRQTGTSVADIAESKESVDRTVEALSYIFKTIKDAAELIEGVATKVSEVDDVASSMAAITEEQSASTEELLSSTDELHGQAVSIADESDKITDVSDKLNGYAEELKEKLEVFTL